MKNSIIKEKRGKIIPMISILLFLLFFICCNGNDILGPENNKTSEIGLSEAKTILFEKILVNVKG